MAKDPLIVITSPLDLLVVSVGLAEEVPEGVGDRVEETTAAVGERLTVAVPSSTVK